MLELAEKDIKSYYNYIPYVQVLSREVEDILKIKLLEVNISMWDMKNILEVYQTSRGKYFSMWFEKYTRSLIADEAWKNKVDTVESIVIYYAKWDIKRKKFFNWKEH